MPLEHLINFLFSGAIGTKDRKGNTIEKQEHFAKKYGVERGTLIAWMSGKQTPGLADIKEMIEGEDYTLGECIDIPYRVLQRQKGAYPDLFRDLTIICETGDLDRIQGIKVNLRDIAAAAVAQKIKAKQKIAKEDRRLAESDDPDVRLNEPDVGLETDVG